MVRLRYFSRELCQSMSNLPLVTNYYKFLSFRQTSDKTNCLNTTIQKQPRQ